MTINNRSRNVIPSGWEGKTMLRCAHAIGGNRRSYRMYCNFIKTMPDGRVKVLVFGDRFNGHYELSRVRYVKANCVIPVEESA